MKCDLFNFLIRCFHKNKSFEVLLPILFNWILKLSSKTHLSEILEKILFVIMTKKPRYFIILYQKRNSIHKQRRIENHLCIFHMQKCLFKCFISLDILPKKSRGICSRFTIRCKKFHTQYNQTLNNRHQIYIFLSSSRFERFKGKIPLTI